MHVKPFISQNKSCYVHCFLFRWIRIFSHSYTVPKNLPPVLLHLSLNMYERYIYSMIFMKLNYKITGYEK